MALTTNPNVWGGDFIQGLNTEVILGGNTIKAGLWRVEPARGEKAVFKLHTVGDDLQVGNLCGITPTADSTFEDVQVDLVTFSVSKAICKYDLDDSSLAVNGPASVLGKVFPQEVIQAEIHAILAKNTNVLEQVRWAGDITAVNPVLASQNGALTQMIQGASIAVGTASAAAITSPATVIDELNRLVAAAPAAVQMHPKFKIVG